MKRLAIALALAACLPLAPRALAQEDVKKVASCVHCGMDREKFAFSRMVIEYDDGSSAGLCSVHCAAVDLAVTLDKAPRSLLVADMGTRKLVDAEKAFWVLGGTRPGVMTKRGKWAFEAKDSAEAFAKENGGALVGFDEIMKATYEDMYADTKMIREKRKATRQQKAAGK